jgi:hypothetical protein
MKSQGIMRQDVGHAAYRLMTRSPRTNPEGYRKSHFHELSTDDFWDPWVRACALLRISDAFAAKLRAGEMNDSDMRAQLKEQCPGFSDETYDLALSDFLSRGIKQ